jgi:DNA-binding transcriptional regulator YdaS (Cro superfamily)
VQLKQYLKKYPVKKSELAKKAGISPAFITYIGQGKKRPSPQVAEKIEKATNGMVTRMELLYPKE